MTLDVQATRGTNTSKNLDMMLRGSRNELYTNLYLKTNSDAPCTRRCACSKPRKHVRAAHSTLQHRKRAQQQWCCNSWRDGFCISSERVLFVERNRTTGKQVCENSQHSRQVQGVWSSRIPRNVRVQMMVKAHHMSTSCKLEKLIRSEPTINVIQASICARWSTANAWHTRLAKRNDKLGAKHLPKKVPPAQLCATANCQHSQMRVLTFSEQVGQTGAEAPTHMGSGKKQAHQQLGGAMMEHVMGGGNRYVVTTKCQIRTCQKQG